MMRAAVGSCAQSMRRQWIRLRDCMSLETVAPSRSLQHLSLVLAAGLVAIGVWGGQYFMENDYVVYGVSVSVLFL